MEWIFELMNIPYDQCCNKNIEQKNVIVLISVHKHIKKCT